MDEYKGIRNGEPQFAKKGPISNSARLTYLVSLSPRIRELNASFSYMLLQNKHVPVNTE